MAEVDHTPPTKRAVLLLAHGTPDQLEDIPKYLDNVVSGRPMPQSVVEEITHRYSLIGKSPLTSLTLEQGRLLSEALGVPVYVGMRNWKPYIVDVVRQMRADGITEAAAICLAPQNSRTSVGLYKRAAFAEAGTAIRMDFTEGWAGHSLLADAFAERLQPILAQVSEETGAPATVLFTAHSVPCRTIQTPADGVPALRPGQPAPGPSSPTEAPIPSVVPFTNAALTQVSASIAATASAQTAALSTPGESTSPAAGAATPVEPVTPPHAPAQWVRSSAEVARADGKPTPLPDPYPVEAKHTAQNIVERTPGLSEDRWCFAFQSQGMSGGPWIGPTVEDTLTALHHAGVKAVVLQTIGFLCDHVEILYDIDIAFKEFAANLGIHLVRPDSLNSSALLTRALVDLSQQSFARLDAAAPAMATPIQHPDAQPKLALQ